MANYGEAKNIFLTKENNMIHVEASLSCARVDNALQRRKMTIQW